MQTEPFRDFQRRSGASAALSFDIRRLITQWADDLIDSVAACPWQGHAGARMITQRQTSRAPVGGRLYSPEERARRDASVWTKVQAILAPLQFVVFGVSLFLVMRYLATGAGYEIATASIIAKTIILYTIMITGAVWEKDVFGQYLFARPFFWEDVVSMLVLALQTLYLLALLYGWWSPVEQIWIAIAAYAAYVINAAQFVWKLRQARLEASPRGVRPQTFSASQGGGAPHGRAA